jgi:hypothetical protein
MYQRVQHHDLAERGPWHDDRSWGGCPDHGSHRHSVVEFRARGQPGPQRAQLYREPARGFLRSFILRRKVSRPAGNRGQRVRSSLRLEVAAILGHRRARRAENRQPWLRAVHAGIVPFRRIGARAGEAEATLLTSGDRQVGNTGPQIAAVESGRVVLSTDSGHPRVRADERRIALVRRIGPVAGHTESARLTSGNLSVLNTAALGRNQPRRETTEDVLIGVVRLLGHGAQLIVDVGAALVGQEILRGRLRARWTDPAHQGRGASQAG